MFEYTLEKIGRTGLMVEFDNIQPEFDKFRGDACANCGEWVLRSAGTPSMGSYTLWVPGIMNESDHLTAVHSFLSTRRRDEAYDAFKALLDEFLKKNTPWKPVFGERYCFANAANVVFTTWIDLPTDKGRLAEGSAFPGTPEGREAACKRFLELAAKVGND